LVELERSREREGLVVGRMQEKEQPQRFDHSIVVVIPHCSPVYNTSTTSQQAEPSDQNTITTERIHRFHGTCILNDASDLIFDRLNETSNNVATHPNNDANDETSTVTSAMTWNMDEQQSCKIKRDICATACVLFHRFFQSPNGSIYEIDVWSVSMASLLLASKIHDMSIISVRSIVHAFCYVYRNRVLKCRQNMTADDTALHNLMNTHVGLATAPEAWQKLSQVEQQRRLCPETISLSTHGPLYLEWYNAIIQTECRLLQQFGYIVYWIPEYHSHNFVQSFCRLVDIVVPNPNDHNRDSNEGNDPRQLWIDTTYKYCHDASYIDICVRYQPELICCATMYCAALKLEYKFPSTDVHWWKNLWTMHPNEYKTIQENIDNIVTAIDAMRKDPAFRIAASAFIPSKLPNNGGFNDPNSFVWEMLIVNA
jgi:cyclin L